MKLNRSNVFRISYSQYRSSQFIDETRRFATLQNKLTRAVEVKMARTKATARKGKRKKPIEILDDNNESQIQQYIGGAEKARRNAQKRCKSRQGGKKKNSQDGSYDSNIIPMNVRPPMDRFFGCLFHPKAKDIACFHSDRDVRKRVIENSCSRVGVACPTKLPSTYADNREYYDSLSSQILLESFAILSDEMNKKRSERKSLSNSAEASEVKETVVLSLEKVEVVEDKKKSFRRVKLIFHRDSSTSFTNTFDEKAGGCFQLMPLYTTGVEEVDRLFPVFASMCGQSFSSTENHCFTVYNNEIVAAINDMKCVEWLIYPICNLISEARQFEVCQARPKVSFLPKLLGIKNATHVRFVDGENGETEEEVTFVGTVKNNSDEDLPSLAYLPKLNPTQERLVKNYLSSSPSSLSLVQVRLLVLK